MARYIDADALIQDIKEDSQLYYFNSYAEKINYESKVEYAIDRIVDAPTEDVAPIVYGKWNDWYFENGYTDAFHCQICQHLFAVTQGKENMNFCPNCGAKMEELGEEE